MTIIWCMAPNIRSMADRIFFVILDCFLPFYFPNKPKNQKFEKLKKNAWRYMFLFYKQLKFRKQAGACLWKKLVLAQSMLALCLFINILLGACLRKRPDQTWNILIEKKKSKIQICHFQLWYIFKSYLNWQNQLIQT